MERERTIGHYFRVGDHSPTQINATALLAAYVPTRSSLPGFPHHNSALDKTIAGVAIVVDAVLLLQLLDIASGRFRMRSDALISICSHSMNGKAELLIICAPSCRVIRRVEASFVRPDPLARGLSRVILQSSLLSSRASSSAWSPWIVPTTPRRHRLLRSYHALLGHNSRGERNWSSDVAGDRGTAALPSGT